MDGRIGGLNLNGRKMRTWLENGTTPLVNGMETPMIKVLFFIHILLPILEVGTTFGIIFIAIGNLNFEGVITF